MSLNFQDRLEISCHRQHSTLQWEAFATDVERVESVGEVRAFLQAALVCLPCLLQAFVLVAVIDAGGLYKSLPNSS